MNNSKQVFNVARIYYRHMSQATEKVPPKFAALKTVQKKFQVDDGVPVFIKRGFGDKLIYNATFALALAGVGLSLHTFYRLVFKN